MYLPLLQQVLQQIIEFQTGLETDFRDQLVL